ncbi:enoyl-CoA hydratase-related protein [Bradyrhizobium sp. LHD-71]|uniref:enoyl-CoA hydratase/isomerase family protein n=1 Tax=Bradyrhizobium sp. LHD-71 TaxID=3072141 RepID=UPI002810191F|nr:enoyl-CoA hydratase-related protein [Bradyrhizobium sp. LHD-71]MDQ8728222.1 enoyl-CoA hydratase-related protein [Bradyrhizobium sp. LHD-71]
MNQTSNDTQPAAGSEVIVEAPRPGVCQIRMNRPERLNALGLGMVEELKRAVEDAIASGARVVLFRGTGRGFCAGADLKERRTMGEAERLRHNRAINAAVDAVAACPVPTIAVINGLALGGGCELALACDLRIAAQEAQIGLTEARIGAIPGAGGTQRMPRLIGASRALELMLTGEPITARRAEQIGLVNAALPAEELDAYVERLSGILASRSVRSAKLLKRVVYEGLKHPIEHGLAVERTALSEIFSSADYAEGLAAFAEKRPPNFAA